MVKVDRQWEYLKIYGKESQEIWNKEFIDIAKYKGKNIILVFSLECVGINTGAEFRTGGTISSEWYLQHIQIVPNFEPSP